MVNMQAAWSVIYCGIKTEVAAAVKCTTVVDS